MDELRGDEMSDRFRRKLDRARDQAESIHAPKDVRARVHVQAGRQILVGTCPVCGTVAALSGEGRHLCVKCFTWLRFIREE